MEQQNVTLRYCIQCYVPLNQENWHPRHQSRRWYICGSCYLFRRRVWRRKHIGRAMLRDARFRSKRKKVPCTITLNDIEELLSVTKSSMMYPHKTFDYGAKRSKNPNAPVLDEIIPGKGYIPGNIGLITRDENSRKSNTTVEQFIAMIEYIKKYAPALYADRCKTISACLT